MEQSGGFHYDWFPMGWFPGVARARAPALQIGEQKEKGKIKERFWEGGRVKNKHKICA